MKKWIVFQKSIRKENRALHFLNLQNWQNSQKWKNCQCKEEEKLFRKKPNNNFVFYTKKNQRHGIMTKATFDYISSDKNEGDKWYVAMLENKAEAIKNSKNNFNKIKHVNKRDEKKVQLMDYTTLHLLASELNILLCGSVVEHVTQVDEKTIVLHLTKTEATSLRENGTRTRNQIETKTETGTITETKTETETDTKTDTKTEIENERIKEKNYFLYICYNEKNPVISLGLQIRKLFNRCIDDDYAQKLNPLLKYSVISNVYMKRNFIKILCIDFVLKNKKNENIEDLENIEHILSLENDTTTSTSSNDNENKNHDSNGGKNGDSNSNRDRENSRNYYDTRKKVTLLFDLHYNSCASFVLNKKNNEIIVSPYNYIAQKVIDKSFKEGHTYIFPNEEECKTIPNHYEFFSSFLNSFKSRKDQKFITSMMQMYEGISYNLLLQFFNYLRIPVDATFEQLDKSILLDFFNNAYIKWVRFLILKEPSKHLMFYPHYDYNSNIYNSIKLWKLDKTIPINVAKELMLEKRENTKELKSVEKMNNVTEEVNGEINIRKKGEVNLRKNEEIEVGMKDVVKTETKDVVKTETKDEMKTKTEGDLETEKAADAKEVKSSRKEVKFDTVIEMVYYSYVDVLPVNRFYTMLNFSKEYINKKLPMYYELMEQYNNNKEITEKVYWLHEHLNKLTVFNHNISKMKDWIDKKTFDALQLIEQELKCNPFEDNRKKYVKKMEQQKQKDEIFDNKIKMVKPKAVKTAQNIFKGSLVMRINEADLSSPFLIIGKNSKQNEKISTQILKFNDLWFHVHEHPGGHVILRNKKINGTFITADTNLDSIEIDDDIKYAANIAAYFSKVRKMEKTLVCFTLGKYVKKDSSMNEGAVEILKYKVVYGRPSKVSTIIKDLQERNKEIELFQKKKKK